MQKQYDDAVAGLGEVKPNVTVAGVSESSGTDGHGDPALDLAARATAGPTRRRCRSRPRRTATSGRWSGSRTRVEPSLTAGRHPRRDHRRGQARRHPRPRRRRPGHRAAGRALRRRPAQGGRGPGARLRPPAGAARRHRRRVVRQTGQGRRAEGVHPGDRLPPGRGAAGRDQRLRPDQGCRRDRRLAAAGHRQGVRGADPRHGRPGHGRDDQGPPRPLPGRRPGRALRPRGAVRRAAARHGPGCRSNAVGRGRQADRALRDRAGEGPAAAPDARAAAATAGRADPLRRRDRPARSSRSGRRPARSSRRPTARATNGYNDATYGRFAPARRSRQSARSRC